MKLILATVWLILLSRAYCHNIFYGCNGNQEIYVQWYPPVSGWYNRTSDNQFTRFPPAKEDNKTDLEKYELTRERGEWNLSKWSKDYYKTILKNIKGNEFPSRKPLVTNLYAQSRSKRSGRRQLTSDFNKKKEKNSLKEIPGNAPKPVVMNDIKQDLYSGRENSANAQAPIGKPNGKQENNLSSENQPIIGEDNPTFNIYCPNKCRCLRSVVRVHAYSTVFSRLDVASSSTREACWVKFGNISGLPEELKIVTRNSNETDNLDYEFQETAKIDKASNLWKSEIFVSDVCDVLYFNKRYDTWIVDREWEGKDCENFRSYKGGLHFYISGDSSPCLEYLPHSRHQRWSNPQLVLPEEDQFTSEDLIQHCDTNFTLHSSQYFNVVCLDLEPQKKLFK